MSGKAILFYSSYCQFSRDIINYIVKKDLKPNFVFIPVESNKDRIPPQVDRVPALLLGQTGHIIFEDDILQFINTLCEDVEPQEHLSSAYSDNFSFIEGEDMNSNTSTSLCKNFAIFGNEQRIHTPEEEGVTKSENNKMLDTYKNQRDVDIKGIFGDRRIVG
jgi:hypothetical protein